MSLATWFVEDFVLLPNLRECEVWIPVNNKSRCTKSWHNSRSCFSKAVQVAASFGCFPIKFDANPVKMLWLLIKICFKIKLILHKWSMVEKFVLWKKIEAGHATCKQANEKSEIQVIPKNFFAKWWCDLSQENTTCLFSKVWSVQPPFPCGRVKGYLWVWKSRSTSWKYAGNMALMSRLES